MKEKKRVYLGKETVEKIDGFITETLKVPFNIRSDIVRECISFSLSRAEEFKQFLSERMDTEVRD